jgi:hypothetical protein
MKSICELYDKFWEYTRYEKLYLLVDIHGTIFKPSFDKEETYQYYPWAKQCLQELSKDPKVVLILWSGCYTHNFMKYINKFEEDNINFNYINENPECSNSSYACFDSKFYFDIGIDDKFGFDPNIDWSNFYPRIIKHIKYGK